MERFLTNYTAPPAKKRKSDGEKKVTQKLYEEKRVRRFVPKWSQEFSWLKNCDDIGMTCVICSQYDTDRHGSFITGCKNYKKDTILSHEKSDGHIMNVKKHNAALDPSNTVAAKTIRSMNQQTISRLVLLFKNVHAISKKGRPYTDYQMLCDLDQAKGLDIGTQYRTDKKAAEFASSIAEAERVRIRKNLATAKFISVISDGSTDSSFQETEIVYVRTCQAGNISVNFSLVKNIPKGDAVNIVKVMSKGLENCVDNYKTKLVAVGCDGASVMLGRKTGAVQRLRELTNRPWLVAVHCSGHKLELAYKDMVRSKIPIYEKIDAFLLTLYYFYRNSNLNRALLKDSFHSLNKSVILPTRVGGTRWISHLKKAITCYLKGYEAISQHLNQLQNPDVAVSRTEKGNKAKALCKLVFAKDAYYMMHFLLDCLTVLVDVSLKFQEKTATVSEVLSEVEAAVVHLEKLKTSDGLHLRQGKETAPDTLKGNLRSFDSARIKFIDQILIALQKRFTDNPGILEACSVMSLSAFATTEEAAESYGDSKVGELVDYFTSALEEAGFEPDKCEAEWTKLKKNIFKRIDKPNKATWSEVNEKFQQLCPNFLALSDLVLTFPASSTDAERGFNRLKITKTDWRSRLTDTHLTDQLMVMLESPDVLDYDPLPAIHIWSATPRRIRNVTKVKSQTLNDTLQSDSVEDQTVINMENSGASQSFDNSASEIVAKSLSDSVDLSKNSDNSTSEDIPAIALSENINIPTSEDDGNLSDSQSELAQADSDSDYESDECYSGENSGEEEYQYIPIKSRRKFEHKANSLLNKLLVNDFGRFGE